MTTAERALLMDLVRDVMALLEEKRYPLTPKDRIWRLRRLQRAVHELQREDNETKRLEGAGL